MSEWTKDRQEELKDIANDCGTNVFSHVRSRDLIDALEEIERLQSEVDKINAILKDPAAVQLNILRGLIALPDMYIDKYATNGEFQILQSEVAALRSQQAELIEAGNNAVVMIGWDIGEAKERWEELVDKLTGGTDAHND